MLNNSLIGTVNKPKRIGVKRLSGLNLALRTRQQGVTLLISLIVLVIMTLAGIQLMRSVDTTNIIAGNLSFQQAATHSGDTGIEAAIFWLETQKANSPNVLNSDTAGYTSYYAPSANAAVPPNPTLNPDPPANGATWDTWWNSLCHPNNLTCNPKQIIVLAPDTAGNTTSYTINRICNLGNAAPTGVIGQYCSSPPGVTSCTGTNAGNSASAGAGCFNIPGGIYYRITSRIDGPRQSKSYVQAMVAM